MEISELWHKIRNRIYEPVYLVALTMSRWNESNGLWFNCPQLAREDGSRACPGVNLVLVFSKKTV